MGSVVEFHKLLDDHAERIASLEQTVSSPASTQQTQPILVRPPAGGPPIVLAGPEDGPANLRLTHHLAGSTITVVAQWDPVQDAVAYDLEWATKDPTTGLYTIVNVLRTIATSMSVGPLLAAHTYGFKVYAVNNFGLYSLPTPADGYMDIATSTDLTPPPAPQNVIVALGQTSVIVRWDPYDPTVVTDFQAYHIQVSNDGFNTYQEIFTSAFVVQFPNVDTVHSQWVARVSGIDTSSNEGPYSTSTNYPVRSSSGVNDSMMVGDFSAAHITFGTMLGDRIQATSLSVQALQTSMLTAASIHLLGGAFTAGDVSGVNTGLLINSQGMRLFKAGTITMAMDAITGDATFSGTLTAVNINGGTITGVNITASDFYVINSISQSFVRISDVSAGGVITIGNTLYDNYPASIHSSSTATKSILNIVGPQHAALGNYATFQLSAWSPGSYSYTAVINAFAEEFSVFDVNGISQRFVVSDLGIFAAVGGSQVLEVIGNDLYYWATGTQCLHIYSGGYDIYNTNGQMSVGWTDPVAGFKYAMYLDVDHLNIGGFFNVAYSTNDIWARGGNFYANGSIFQNIGGSCNAVFSDTYSQIDSTPSFAVFYGATQILYADSGTCDINGNVYAPSFNVSSSRALKRNIKRLDITALPLLKQLQAVDFEFNNSDTKRYGFIAEDALSVIPQIVTGSQPIIKKIPHSISLEDRSLSHHEEEIAPATSSIDVMGLVAILVKSVQELTSKVELLEASGGSK